MDESTIDLSTKDAMLMRSASGTPDSSKQSTDRGNDNSPLMKLVDAALGPTSYTEIKDVELSGNEEVKVEEANGLDDTNFNEDERSQMEDDTKIIRGTIHDLVSRQEKKLTFAEFLMQCLNDQDNGDVLRWMPCGTQFTITNHRKFTMERMPQLFKIRNMSSFVRKLTRWGFSRVHEKATGNSDIFKHPLFQRDKPELCKRIRCVNRSTIEDGKTAAISMDMRLGSSTLMSSFSESSSRHPGIDFEHDMSLRLSSPRRSIGHSVSHFHGRSPIESSRYHFNQTPRGSTPYLPPRISPESEREMMERSAFHSRLTPPQVHSPPLLSRTMSAAAEYELEQVLLERQRARMYRSEQQHHLQPGHQQHLRTGSHPVDLPLPSTRILLDPGSERSMDSLSDRRYGNGQSLFSSPADTNSITAALEKLQREGEYDLDMSPREAMLRAVLHKRQQQRAVQHHRAGSSSHGILRHHAPNSTESPTTRESNRGNPSFYR
jgi:hypothetical protein